MEAEPGAGLRARDRSPAPLHPWLAALGWIAGGLLIVFVVRDYALTLYGVFAPSHIQEFADAVVLSGTVLWWTLVAISLGVTGLLIVCWPGEGRRGRRALAMIGAGLVAYWSWKLLDGWLDPWGLRSFTDVTPELMQRATTDAIVSQAITVIAASLMIAGSVRLRRDGSPLAA